MIFSNTLIFWYLQNQRDLPWRKTKEPYYVWLSEIILQQTRVAQGTPYFLKFTEAFPTVFDLAKANEHTVLKLWQGLGYYSRARNLHFSAKYIVDKLDGKFPDSYNDLLQLKGVGDYTAAAIASICFDEPTAVVDGNVYRVLARYFGIKTPINSTAGKKEFKALAQKLINLKQPGLYNQAIMEFGALHCKPKNPFCADCVLASSCVALNEKQIQNLPVKEKKATIKHRYFNYLVVVTADNKTVFEKRKNKDVWQGLYQFPLIETSKYINEEELIFTNTFSDLFSSKTSVSLFNQNKIVHKLSHQHIHTRFWIVETKQGLKNAISWKNVKKYPVSILIANFLKEFIN
ncbi:A/G-specific adenine glycosylase [Tenacibaculum sp. UWU-22]|uniref:A/G-specific adenine glycosylase n=1 Tax=Tenacibaculum sp. UWU-22 TaxID=3234187 RepID=UPI0034DAF960